MTEPLRVRVEREGDLLVLHIAGYGVTQAYSRWDMAAMVHSYVRAVDPDVDMESLVFEGDVSGQEWLIPRPTPAQMRASVRPSQDDRIPDNDEIYPIDQPDVCWVCQQIAWYVDIYFEAPVCGSICSWAAWEAMRLHDTPWRAW